MAEGITKFVESVWFKIICLSVGALFTLISSFGVYHLNKLDDIVRDLQSDKIELIDRINTIDSIREDDIDEVKLVMNQINTTLQSFIARTDASRFTSEDGLEVWREIAKIKQQIHQIEVNQEKEDRNNR